MANKHSKIMRRTGAWNIVMGITVVTVGLAVGVGCLISGGALLSNSSK